MSLALDPALVLEKPLMAHLATASPDGPRHSPVWFLWEEGAIWLVSGSGESLADRLAAEPRCAIGIVDFDNDRGILRHVGMRGRAELRGLDLARRNRLLAKYIGPDESLWRADFKAAAIDSIDVLVEFVPDGPDSIVARDQSYFSQASPHRYGQQGSNDGQPPA